MVTAACLLCDQISLGALTVWELLAAWTVTSHLITGNSVNASLWLAASRLSKVWTAVTKDGSYSAHFEHCVAITSNGPWVLTRP